MIVAMTSNDSSVICRAVEAPKLSACLLTSPKICPALRLGLPEEFQCLSLWFEFYASVGSAGRLSRKTATGDFAVSIYGVLAIVKAVN